MAYAKLGRREDESLAWEYLKRSLRGMTATAGEGPVAAAFGDGTYEGGEAIWGRDVVVAPPTLSDDMAPDGGGGNATLDASIHQTEEAIVIRANLPGVTREDIHVELMENILMLRVDREGERNGGFAVRPLKKSFVLPGSACLLPEMMRATLADGVFRLEIPKQG